MHRRVAVSFTALAVLAAAVGCDGAGPTTPSPNPVKDIRPVDPRFDEPFWKEFVFNGHDNPGLAEREIVRVQPTTSPNIYIRMGDPTGQQRVVSSQHRDHIRRAVPRLAEQLTGQPYRGRIEDGMEDPGDRPGWVVVVFATSEEALRLNLYCGIAVYDRIWIGRGSCREDEYFSKTFAHEFGHVMGFKHVADRRTVMHKRSFYTDMFTEREQYHARLAYEVGPGARYCGWPFGPDC